MVPIYWFFDNEFVIKKIWSHLMNCNLLERDSCFIDPLDKGVEIVNFVYYNKGEKFDVHTSLSIALKEVTEKRKRDAIAGIEHPEIYYHNYFDRLVEDLTKGHYVRGHKHFLLFLN